MTNTAHYTVVELHRYTTKPGARALFGSYFDTWFPEAFQQLGAIVFGHFFERGNPRRFTWLRGFRDAAAREAVNEAFYGGPVWAEHHQTMTALTAAEDVLLLRPLRPDCALPALKAVDPLSEPRGAQGTVVIQIFRARPGQLEACAEAAEDCFAAYRGVGLIEAGILVTLNEDHSPHLVWVGILRDDEALDAMLPSFHTAEQCLAMDGVLEGPAELVILNPASRSRLRWVGIGESLALAA